MKKLFKRAAPSCAIEREFFGMVPEYLVKVNYEMSPLKEDYFVTMFLGSNSLRQQYHPTALIESYLLNLYRVHPARQP